MQLNPESPMHASGPVLALETSTDLGSVAIGDGEELFVETTFRVAGGHSAALLPAIDSAIRSAGLAPAELVAIVVGGGPGSFTGLRIGAATAKGIAHALDIPLWAYSGLLAVAAVGWGSDRPVCALFDARRRDVYAACYRIGGREKGRGKREDENFAGIEREARSTGTSGIESDRSSRIQTLLEPTALSLDELLERLRGEEPPLFAGEGAVLHGAEIERELDATVLPPHLGIPRAAALIALLYAAPGAGRVNDPAGWEPDYVRASGAERIAAARATGGAGASR